MNLGEILAELKKVQPLADEDVSGGPLETLRGRQGRKEQAISQLADLRGAYERELRRTAAFILVVGDKREEFVALATESFKCFNTNPETLFIDLVNKISPTLYLGRENMANIFDILGRHLEDKAIELGIVGYPQLIYTQEYHRHCGTREEFLSLVKQAIVNKVGGELVGIQAAKSLTAEAIAKNNAAKYTPVLLPTGDERFALKIATDLDRISTRVFIIAVGNTTDERLNTEDVIRVPEANATSVRKALKTVSDSIKRVAGV
jgi:hypothetical protein